MIPILYENTETKFDNNGIGILADVISSPVSWELNGQYEVTIKYPVSGVHFSSIGMRSIVAVQPNPTSDLQPFRVYHITKPSSGIVTIHARHLAYDLMGVPVSPFSAGSVVAAVQGIKQNVAVPSPFTFITDKSGTGRMHVDVPKSVWSLMGGSEGSLLDVYGGEYEFNRFTVKLCNRLGADRGTSIRYGKNLTSLEQDENCANCYTGVYPYWADREGNRTELPEKILNAPGSYDHTKILILDLSQEWTEQPSVSQLKTRASRYIKDNNIGVPSVSLKVEFVSLAQTDEYKDLASLEQVRWGDTVTVSFAEMGIDATARVVATEYDPLTERFNHIRLGRVKANIADTIVHQQQQIEKAPTTTDLEKAKIAATAWLTNGKGYKVERRDANGNTIDTLYMDTPDINTAVNVLRVGQSGIGFSHSGVNGPYESAWTIDGVFNADFILAGALNAALIKAGVLQSKDGKTFVLDLDAGVLKMQANELSIAGQSVSDIADVQITEFDKKLGQSAVLNKLTNNGEAEGIFMRDNQLYVNATYLAAGEMQADIIKLLGTFAVYHNSKKVGGLGYVQGGDNQTLSDGVGLQNAAADCRVAVTDLGVAITAGSNVFVITKRGSGKFNCDLLIDGDLTVNGTVRAWDIIKTTNEVK